jgi:hypothetical protein
VTPPFRPLIRYVPHNARMRRHYLDGWFVYIEPAHEHMRVRSWPPLLQPVHHQRELDHRADFVLRNPVHEHPEPVNSIRTPKLYYIFRLIVRCHFLRRRIAA